MAFKLTQVLNVYYSLINSRQITRWLVNPEAEPPVNVGCCGGNCGVGLSAVTTLTTGLPLI